MSSATIERDRARTDRDRARDKLAKIRGIVVSLSAGVTTNDAAISAIARILRVRTR